MGTWCLPILRPINSERPRLFPVCPPTAPHHKEPMTELHPAPVRYEPLLPPLPGSARVEAMLQLSACDAFSDHDRRALLFSARDLARQLGDEQQEARCELQLAERRFEPTCDGPAEAMIVRAQAELLIGQPLCALEAYLMAADVAAETHDQRLELDAQQHAGLMLIACGEDQQGVDLLGQVLARGQERPVATLLALAHAQHRLGALDAAFATYREAGRWVHGTGTAEQADVLGGLGAVLADQGDADGALSFLKRAVQVAEHRGDFRRHGQLLCLIARTWSWAKDAAGASNLFEAALAAVMRAPVPLPEVQTEVALAFADHLLRCSHFGEAARYLDQVMPLLHDPAVEPWRMDWYQLQARLAAGQHKVQHALETQQAGHQEELSRLQRTAERRQQVYDVRQRVQLQLELRAASRHFEERSAGMTATIQNLQQRVEKLKAQVFEDPETGAKSSRYGVEQLKNDFWRSQRAKTELAIAIIGVNAPLYADTQPPPSDLMLPKVAGVLLNLVRSSDVVARFNAYQFMVIFPETGPEGARQVMERAVDRLAREEWASTEQDVRAKISVGVAARGFLQGAQLLMEAADEQYYRARRTEGNVVCVAE